MHVTELDELDLAARDPQEHLLKTWPSEWEAIRNGFKRFEWRQDDRPLGYRVGDTLVLRQYDPLGKNFVGEFELPQRYQDLRALVTYVLRGDTAGAVFGVPHGYCIMSIQLTPREGLK